MKWHWVLWATITLTCGEKLDRTYLPPVGSITSGGSQGAIDLPFEFPKYSVTEKDFPVKTEIAIGIDRVAPKQYSDIFKNTPTANNENDILEPITYNFEKATSILDNDGYLTTVPETSFDSNHPSTDYASSQHISDNNVSNVLPISGRLIKTEQTIPDKSSTSSPLYNVSGDAKATVSPSEVNFIPNSYFITSTITNITSNHDSSIYPSSPNSSDKQYKYSYSTPPYLSDNLYSTIDSQLTSTTSTNLGIKDGTHLHDGISQGRSERPRAQVDREAVILNYDQIRTPDGYAYSYDTSNGIHADENATAINGVRAKGSYSYVGDDGKVYSVVYTADENGFQPRGLHLPTSPPIPDEILKVIQQAEKQKGNKAYDDGFYDDDKYGYRRYNGRVENQRHPLINGVDIPPTMSDSNFEKHNNYKDLEQQRGSQKLIINPYDSGYEITTEEQNVTPTSYNNIFNENSKNSEFKYFKEDNISEPQYERNPIIDNNTKELISTEYPLINTNGEVSIGTKDDKTKIYKESGYSYFPPQNEYYNTETLKAFPSRFSGIDHDSKLKEDDIVTERVTVKPFLTPYVSRKDDDLENYDSENYNASYPTSLEKNLEPNLNYFISNRKLDEDLQHDSNLNNFDDNLSDKSGYFYSKNKLDSTVPAEFTPQFTSTKTNDIIPGTSTTPFRIPTTSTPDYFSQTTRSGFIVDDPIKGYPSVNGSSEIILTTQNAIPGSKSEITRFSMQFRPTDATVYPYTYSKAITPEKNIGENFTGPRQDQRYDSINGYYY